MTVYSMRGDYLSECTYVLVEKGKAVVVDPGTSAERIIAECAKIGADLVGVLLTHGHSDHTLGARGLQEKGVSVYAHRDEVDVLTGRASLALALGLKDVEITPDVCLSDGDEINLLDIPIKVIFTPGHTHGGVCYLVNDALFSGDTLFPGSYGRTDFPTGDEQDLINSICNELFALPPDVKVYAGHDDSTFDLSPCKPSTTIGEEYSTNPILYLL